MARLAAPLEERHVMVRQRLAVLGVVLGAAEGRFGDVPVEDELHQGVVASMEGDNRLFDTRGQIRARAFDRAAQVVHHLALVDVGLDVRETVFYKTRAPRRPIYLQYEY